MELTATWGRWYFGTLGLASNAFKAQIDDLEVNRKALDRHVCVNGAVWFSRVGQKCWELRHSTVILSPCMYGRVSGRGRCNVWPVDDVTALVGGYSVCVMSFYHFYIFVVGLLLSQKDLLFFLLLIIVKCDVSQALKIEEQFISPNSEPNIRLPHFDSFVNLAVEV